MDGKLNSIPLFIIIVAVIISKTMQSWDNSYVIPRGSNLGNILGVRHYSEKSRLSVKLKIEA